MEWITCGLPLKSDANFIPECIKPDNLPELEKELFGTTYDEEYAKLDSEIMLSYIKATLKIEEEYAANNSGHQISYSLKLKELEKMHDPNINIMLAWGRFQDKYDAWYDTLPEAELSQKKWLKDIEDQKALSFMGQGLNIPGTLIDTCEGQFLIGHINPYADCGGDEDMFDSNPIVKRYKIVWSLEEEDLESNK